MDQDEMINPTLKAFIKIYYVVNKIDNKFYIYYNKYMENIEIRYDNIENKLTESIVMYDLRIYNHLGNSDIDRLSFYDTLYKDYHFLKLLSLDKMWMWKLKYDSLRLKKNFKKEKN